MFQITLVLLFILLLEIQSYRIKLKSINEHPLWPPKFPKFDVYFPKTLAAASITTLLGVCLLPSVSHGEMECMTSLYMSNAEQTIVSLHSTFTDGLICGGVINAAKNVILHPIETVKTRLDTGTRGSGLIEGVYSGIIPAMVGGVPAAALFFGTKDILRTIFRNSFFNLDPKAATILSVTLATLPYWLLRNPSEVIKTRIRTQTTNTTLIEILQRTSLSDYYSGLLPNLLYSLPSDWLKFLTYEIFSNLLFGIQEGQLIPAQQALICGGLAALVAETICTPLDVVRTRIMCIEKLNPVRDTSTSNSMTASSSSTTSILKPKRLNKNLSIEDDATSEGNIYLDSGNMQGDVPFEYDSEGELRAKEGTVLLSRLNSQKVKTLKVSEDLNNKVPLDGLTQLASTPTATAATNGGPTDTMTMIVEILRNEGLESLFAGAAPRSARALLDGAVQFVAYETTFNFLHGH